jgi:hypothetical protein
MQTCIKKNTKTSEKASFFTFLKILKKPSMLTTNMLNTNQKASMLFAFSSKKQGAVRKLKTGTIKPVVLTQPKAQVFNLYEDISEDHLLALVGDLS